MKASTQGLLIAGGISTLAVLVYIIIRQINKGKTTVPLPITPVDPNVPNPDPVAACMEAEAMAGITQEEMRRRILLMDWKWFWDLSPQAKTKIQNCPLIAEMFEKVQQLQ